jgi:hypothetical protein
MAGALPAISVLHFLHGLIGYSVVVSGSDYEGE